VTTQLQNLQSQLGYVFADESVLALALTHRSASRSSNNERLEFLGDALLGRIIAQSLYEQFSAASEGQLTRMRATLVREKTLAEIARELNLGRCLLLGPGELKSGGWRRDSILADALEAIIAAIFLDGGESACQQVVTRLYQSRLNLLSPEAAHKDAKTQLQEWLQGRQYQLPVYDVETVEGQAPKQVFHVCCQLTAQRQVFRASGDSRRKAEQQAARLALEWIRNAAGE